MIKPIDEIPMNAQQSRKSYRDEIRNDIREAMEKGIDKFEFVGDYNYKYLHQYAREEADKIKRELFYKVTYENRERWKSQYPEASLPTFYDFHRNSQLEIFSVSSIKGETVDKRRVFCRISMTADEYMKRLEELIDGMMPERQKQGAAYRKMMEMRQRPKLKLEGYDDDEQGSV